MNAVDGSQHYEKASTEQNPSLLTVILDTNPAAWSLLSGTLSLSEAVASLLIFINAHLACNYTNKIAVIASHCDRAQWLYPTPTEQHPAKPNPLKRRREETDPSYTGQLSEPSKRLRANGPENLEDKPAIPPRQDQPESAKPDSTAQSQKYRPFRVVEEEVLTNLTRLLATSDPLAISSTSSTKVAGALTLALSYVNRQTVSSAESGGGGGKKRAESAPANAASRAAEASNSNSNRNVLHSRILLLSVSSSHDLANQYIPVMNSIFACQRLSIPIDICQIPTPLAPPTSTVFLQQACDATKGIYIPLTTTTSGGLLQYLMMAFLPTQASRLHLIVPTRIDVDFRAACFCHRRIVDIGFVCSICLSIFCSVPENGDCLTCGTHLQLGDYGGRPMVLPPRTGTAATAAAAGVGATAGKKRKKIRATATPTPEDAR